MNFDEEFRAEDVVGAVKNPQSSIRNRAQQSVQMATADKKKKKEEKEDVVGVEDDALPGNQEAEEEALGLDDGLIFMDKKVFFCGYCGNKFRHGGALYQHELHAHKLKTEMGQGNKEDEGNESEKSTAGIIPFLKANEDTIPFPEKDVPHWIVENVLFDLTWDMIMKKKEEEEAKKRRDQKLTQAFLAMGYDLQSQEVTGRLASLCTVHKLDEDMIAVLYYYFVDQNVITHQSPHMEAMDDFDRYLYEAAADKNTENTDIPSTSAASDEMTTSKGGSWEAFRTLAIKFCNYFLPSTNCTGG